MCKGRTAAAVIPLHWEQTYFGMALVVVAIIAVDLAANFATGPRCGVNVDVCGARTHRSDQFIDLTSVDSLSPSGSSRRNIRTNVGSEDGARNRRRRRGTRLRTRRTIAQVGAQKHADAAVYALLSKVDVRLLDGAFEVLIAQCPVNAASVITDPRIELAGTGCRDRRDFFISG